MLFLYMQKQMTDKYKTSVIYLSVFFSFARVNGNVINSLIKSVKGIFQKFKLCH